MSVRDRTSPAAGRRRLLGRALVVAGATVVSTSAAWLAGAGNPANAAEPQAGEQAPVVAQATDSTESPGIVDSRTGAGPAASPLDDLDPRALVRSGPAQRLLTPIDGALRDSAEGVRHVAETLPIVESESVPSGQRPDVPAPEPSMTTPTPSPSAGAEPAQPRHESPQFAATDPPTHDSPSAGTAAEESAPSAPITERHTPEPQRAPTPPAPDERMPVSTGAASVHTADLQQTGAALGRHPAAPEAEHIARGALAQHNDTVLHGVPAPQPGASPD